MKKLLSNIRVFCYTQNLYLRSRIVFVLFLFPFLLFTACIKSYEPVIETSDAVKFVVTGGVNKGAAVQIVDISTSSTIGNPKYIPVTGCVVSIIDGKGVSYAGIDKHNGKYEILIPPAELVTGAAFKVEILGPDGTHIVSDYDQLNECPDLGNIYYEVQDVPTKNPRIFAQGIQFFVDLDAGNVASRNFMWEIHETWEYHSVYNIEWYYDGKLHQLNPPSDSLSICWQTNTKKSVFTLSTKDLAQNQFNRFKLHLVDNYSTPRLVYGYSLLVNQISLSDKAYEYWNKIQHNSNEQGGLYEKQPMTVKGNLHNLTDKNREILGFFRVGEIKSKRIFVKNVENMEIMYDPGCTTDGVEPRRTGLKGIPPSFYPAYLFATLTGYSIILLNPSCYDCRLDGGDTIRPDFWPN